MSGFYRERRIFYYFVSENWMRALAFLSLRATLPNRHYSETRNGIHPISGTVGRLRSTRSYTSMTNSYNPIFQVCINPGYADTFQLLFP
jgi:hypothetical protein